MKAGIGTGLSKKGNVKGGLGLSVEVRGVPELQAKLQRLKKSTAKKAVRKGSRAGCKDIQKVAKEEAPVVSGVIRKNIKVRAMKRSRKRVGCVVEILDVPYGGPLIYGTKKMEANNFLGRATDKAGERALETAARITAEEIEKELAK
jgi:HK97 gp10 family phage protein